MQIKPNQDTDYLSNTTPIPTFPLRGKENSFLREDKHSLPLRGRARVGVVFNK